MDQNSTKRTKQILGDKKTTIEKTNKQVQQENASTSFKRKLKDEKSSTNKKTKLKHEDDLCTENETISPHENETDISEWKSYEIISEQYSLECNIAKNIIQLFENGNTVPFIARYRKNETKCMSPDQLRDIKNCYDDLCALKTKMKSILQLLSKMGVLDACIKKKITNVTTMEELEHIYAPFKPGGKRTLAERAKELGLEEPARKVLENTPMNISSYINPEIPELASTEAVEKGIIHIIAATIATDTEVLTFLRKLKEEINCTVQTKKLAVKAKESTTAPTKTTNKKVVNKNVDESKYSDYFNFSIPVKYIKPHQVLAINRAETQKVLSVKVVVPDYVFNRFSNFCFNKWRNFKHEKVIADAIKDSYTRLIQPLIIRQIRADLKSKAEKASYEVFSTNLKQLLLAAPLKGRPILGIDPGYTNGCKVALISSTGSVMSHKTIFPHKNEAEKSKSANILKSMLREHNCTLIALGNGTACRKTEEWLTNLIQNQFFHPLEVMYTIVSEDGASIYSCSPEAKKEFPDLDPNIISAVSLARRVQDPLAELVKVDPQHLGVGMYQHDVRKKQLQDLLEEVVSECVSFVGVDLNTASQCILRKIAGLTDKRATDIIKHRDKQGPFINRKQLTEVKGIGSRTFEQCAGFLRILPSGDSSQDLEQFYKQSGTNRLDLTDIHPESYDVTLQIIKKFNLKINDIGKQPFIDSITKILHTQTPEQLSTKLSIPKETVQLICDSLSKPLNYDLRSAQSQSALFKKGLTDINSLSVGVLLTGRVSNVTHFGCFVDIGVGCNGLIHNSKMNRLKLQVGDRVEVKVVNIEIDRKRIGLEAVKKL